MLPQRIARASALRTSLAAARRLPTTQRRGFLPHSYTAKKTVDEKFPEAPHMSEAEDPGQVSVGGADDASQHVGD